MSIPHRHGDRANIGSGSRTFFVTSSTQGRSRVFQVERYAELFCDVINGYAAAHKFQLHAFVVMPDHFHALLSLGADISIEKAVQLIKGGFSYRVSHELGRKGEVWQRGFSEVRVHNDEAFESYRAYIHDNPVKATLVRFPEDYLYSSAAKAGRLKDQAGTTKVVP